MRLGNTADMFMNDSEMTAGIMCMMHLKTISALEERAMNTILNSIITYL